MEQTNQPELTHLNKEGLPRMVDVGDKRVTRRVASARGSIRLPSGLQLEAGAKDIQTRKGAVIQTAIVAGTQAVKKTAEMIPFCHPLPVDAIEFNYQFIDHRTLEIRCEVKVEHKTGVEMEALTGVSVALLTVYDMCKSAGQDMTIQDVEIYRKSGGKSDISKPDPKS